MITEESTDTLSVDDFKRAVKALGELDKENEKRKNMFWLDGKMWTYDGKGNVVEIEHMTLADL